MLNIYSTARSFHVNDARLFFYLSEIVENDAYFGYKTLDLAAPHINNLYSAIKSFEPTFAAHISFPNHQTSLKAFSGSDNFLRFSADLLKFFFEHLNSN